jgi:hypothetical protein
LKKQKNIEVGREKGAKESNTERGGVGRKRVNIVGTDPTQTEV